MPPDPPDVMNLADRVADDADSLGALLLTLGDDVQDGIDNDAGMLQRISGAVKRKAGAGIRADAKALGGIVDALGNRIAHDIAIDTVALNRVLRSAQPAMAEAEQDFIPLPAGDFITLEETAGVSGKVALDDAPAVMPILDPVTAPTVIIDPIDDTQPPADDESTDPAADDSCAPVIVHCPECHCEFPAQVGPAAEQRPRPAEECPCIYPSGEAEIALASLLPGNESAIRGYESATGVAVSDVATPGGLDALMLTGGRPTPSVWVDPAEFLGRESPASPDDPDLIGVFIGSDSSS